MSKEGQTNINFIVGLVIIMVGTLSVTFMGLGFIFNNSNLIWKIFYLVICAATGDFYGSGPLRITLEARTVSSSFLFS